MKDVVWAGNSKDVLRAFPAPVRRDAGYELMRVQAGLNPSDWKPMNSIGAGVREIRVRYRGQYRVIYLANRSDAVYVLHAFQKKTQRTSKTDIDLARARFKDILGDRI